MNGHSLVQKRAYLQILSTIGFGDEVKRLHLLFIVLSSFVRDPGIFSHSREEVERHQQIVEVFGMGKKEIINSYL